MFRGFVSFKEGLYIYMHVWASPSAVFNHSPHGTILDSPDASSHDGGTTLRGKVPWFVHGDFYLIRGPS